MADIALGLLVTLGGLFAAIWLTGALLLKACESLEARRVSAAAKAPPAARAVRRR